jgi:putative membrane protein insertion efficiency factor
MAHPTRRLAHIAIRGYQLTASALVGRQCRHWPSCSDYTDQAIQSHGLWAGGWMGLARICRCNPWGTDGIDLVCEEVPQGASALMPWRYGRWRGVNAPPPLNDADSAPPTPGLGADRSGAPAPAGGAQAMDRKGSD